MTSRSTVAEQTPQLPASMLADIERAGYYPALVADVLRAALGQDQVDSHLVHQETTFDQASVRRHITVLALTASRMVIAHADDSADESADDPADGAAGDAAADAAPVQAAGAVATATTESVPLHAVKGVMLTHVVPDPAAYVPGSLGRELTLTLAWGAVSRLDLVPATCGDPDCEADHGYEGTATSDDIGLRISAAADGDAALDQALAFSQAVSAAIGR